MRRKVIMFVLFEILMIIIFEGCSMYTYLAYSGSEREQSEVGILYIYEQHASQGNVVIVDVDGKIPDEDRPDWPWQEIHFLPGRHTLRVHYTQLVRSWPTETLTWSRVPKTITFEINAGCLYRLDFEASYSDWQAYIKLISFPIH